MKLSITQLKYIIKEALNSDFTALRRIRAIMANADQYPTKSDVISDIEDEVRNFRGKPSKELRTIMNVLKHQDSLGSARDVHDKIKLILGK
jgi:hypothetical protein